MQRRETRTQQERFQHGNYELHVFVVGGTVMMCHKRGKPIWRKKIAIISELLVIKVFDAIETIGQQEETSLLRLVVGHDDNSGTGSSHSSINERVHRAAFELLSITPRLSPDSTTSTSDCWRIERDVTS